MSDEQRNEETEVEGHYGKSSHPKSLANEEPRDEASSEDEVEGHYGKSSHPKSL
jgi:hypothetical protein